MSLSSSHRPVRYRSVFLSDVHLGSRGCSAEYLLEFLRSFDTDTLYLVGDIVDLWSLKKSFFWPQSHNNVLRTILGKARDGTRVIYIPGNHDMLFRDYDGMTFGNVEIRREAIHETADGRRFLVLHGDEFDAVIRASPVVEALGQRCLFAGAGSQSGTELHPAALWISLLVARRLPEAQSEARRPVTLRTSNERSPAKRVGAVWMARSAVIFIGLALSISTVRCTATMAIGSRAARR